MLATATEPHTYTKIKKPATWRVFSLGNFGWTVARLFDRQVIGKAGIDAIDPGW